MVMRWLCLLLLAWPARSDYAPQGSDETVFEEPNGTELVEEELIIQATQSSGSLVVSQGSDLVLADVFQLASQEVAWMKPSYFRLDLLLAEGLSFRKPLPLQCLAARELKQVNPVEEVADEEVSVFSDALLPQRRLQLHAPVEILQKCLQSLTAHVPWNAPITVAEDDFPGPDLMSTVPMNGSVGINSSAMEVLLTFNDWVQPGEGDIQIIDCGFDDLCGQVGTLDDSVVNISVHDTRSVIFFKNLVWVRYSGLVDLHQHLFHVPEGSIKDISGVSFRGLAAEDYTFRTGPILEGTSSNNDSNSTSDPVFTVELPLETNPYVKSTRPIWAEAGANPVRPEEEPDIPFYVERCYLNETNCSSYNGSNCSSWENVSTLGVCGLNERSGMGFLPLEQLQLWRKPWHWLQAAADGSSLLVQLEVKTANSPVLIKARSHVLNATAGVATLLATLEGEEPFTLEDDEATTLYVEVILEPYGEISVSPTAWRRWGGRVNVTFDFPRVQPDWGSLGQGNFSTTTVEGRPASSLNFHGGLQSVQAALGNLTYTAPRDFQGLALMKVVISDGDYLRDELLLVQVAPNPQAPAAVGVPGNVASIPSILTLYNFSSTAEMEPQVSLRHGGAQTAMASTAHHVNVTVVADLDSEDSARVYVKAPFGQLSFPELDAIMDEAGPGLTEFFADGEYDATEAEFVSKASARDGVWPRISAYESPVGAGFTVVGTVAALNRVLGQLQFTPPADSPNSGSLEVSLLRTPSVEEYETTFPLDDGPVAVGNLAVEIGALSKSQYTCFIGGPAATFVNLGEDARNLGVTVEPEVSASAKVTTAIADELHEFRVSVQRGSVSLDVNKFPAARICPPFFPDVGGCAVDEADAWVIYGRIADAALAIESLVYTGPYGYSGQDRMRITGSCSEVGLEVLLNIIKSYLPPAIRCCEDSGMEVHQGVEPAAVPPCALDNNAYGEIPSVAQVTYSSDIGQLAFWPVEGLYFDRGMEASPMHNVSSQIVASGPGEVMRRNLGSKLALLHIPETETRLFGRLVLEVLDVRSGLSSTASCPIQVIPGRMEYHDMPVPADDTTTDQDSGMQNSTEKDAMVEQTVSTAPVVQLRVLSASAVVEAAGSVYLAALALAAAERGLNAVEGDLEVWLSSGQGVLEIDVAALVGSNSAYLADASGGSLTTSKLEQDQVAESGMAMGGQPFRVPSANSRLAYVDPSRPADPENRTLLDPRGPQRPSRVLWSGRSLQLRGSAVNLHQTLSSVKYTADEQAGGWDTVTVTMGRQKGEVPVYIIRRAGAVVLKGRPLERLTVGQILKPDIRLELSPLVRAEDTFSALVACSHCGLALWMYANKMEVISSSLEFAGNTSELEAFLADLTYVPEEGFTGTDWLQVFVQGGRLQAASQVASSAELGMAVSVEQVEKVVPPAAVLMPERFSIFEDSATDPQIQIRVAMVAAEPSDVDDDTDCLNASEADMWLPQDPLALRGSVQLGSFALEGISSMPRLRTMTSCPDELAGDQGHATDGHEQLQTFAQLVDGQQVAQFCVKGHPLALSEFASRLRYQPAQHWAGSEPMRITLTAADDAHVVHAAAQSWVLVQSANDPPSITAIQPAFEVQIGNSVQLAGINISDADMSDTTRWMTLSVAASIGRLYVEDSFLLAPTGTVEPLSGRLDGDFSLRVQGSGPDLQAFVEKLRFSMSAPPKPYLAPRPLDQPETEAIISYILSDTLGPQAAALRRHQVAGKVVNPQTDEPVAGVDVLLLATDTWHDYPGYTMLSGCDVELKGWDIPDCKTYALNHSYPGFSIGLYRVGGALACCFKTADAETILTNLVFDDTASVHIFQPGGYTVRTQTSALGVYAGIMPTGPAEIYFEKYLYASRNLSIWVSDNIQVGGSADIYLQALAVVTIWRFEVDWSSSSPVDLDAHSFDPWDCHVYFANRQCKHVGSHGLTVTLNRDSRDVLNGKEVITVHQWPCDATQAAIGGYRDVWSCLTYFWVQVFSQNNFADVQGKVSIFREGLLLEEVQLPTTADSFWVGFVLDAGSSIVTSQNQTGGSEAVEGFVSGMYLSTFQMPPAREVRRLSQAGRQVPHWQEQLRKELSSEKEADVAQVDYHKLGGTRKLQSSGQYGGLYVPKSLDLLTLEGTALIFTLDSSGYFYTACQVVLSAAKPLPYPPPSWARRLTLPDDGAVEVPLPQPMSFYGQDYNSVFVGSNGYVTFGQPSSNRTGDLDSHFARPGFSALAHDLAPHKPVATVWLEVETVDVLDTRVVITFDNVPSFGHSDANSFQVVLFLPTNQVMISWQKVSSAATGAAIGVAPAIFPTLGVELDPAATVCTNTCPNYVRESFLEECDIGDVYTEGCSDCKVVAGYTCNKVTEGPFAAQARMDFCVPIVCGNGLRETGEECDDRNNRSDDGCSSMCQVEAGYTCSRGDSGHSDVCHGQQPIFTEAFGTSTFDLEGYMLLFKPWNGTWQSDKYELCKQPLLNSAHPDSPSSAARALRLEDDASIQVAFPMAFPFFGSNWTTAWVNSNGIISFDRPYESRRGTLETHFTAPRVVALFADLTPAREDGSVLFEVIDDTVDSRAVITYNNVSEFGRVGPGSSFQVALYFNGMMRLSWSTMNAAAPLVGVSSGARPSKQSLRLETGYLLLNWTDMFNYGIVDEYTNNKGLFTADMTWEVWYKIRSFGTRTPIMTTAVTGVFETGAIGNDRLWVDLDEEGYVIVGAQGRVEYQELKSAAPLTENKWVHIALVVDRGFPCTITSASTSTVCSKVEVYADALKILDLRMGLQGGGANVGITFYDSFEGIAVGGNDLSHHVPVHLAQFRLYSRTLSQTEIGACAYADAPVDSLILSFELDGTLNDLASDFPLSFSSSAVAAYAYDFPESCASTIPLQDDLSSAALCVAASACGDGYREVFEACDDGNTVSGDGCSAHCQVEIGYICMDFVAEMAAAALGTGNDSTNDTNDTNASNETTTTTTAVGPRQSFCSPSVCGDGFLGKEECDDGNTNSTDGCSSTCTVETGYYCTQPLGNQQPSLCTSRCGDGHRVIMHEQCDDANTISGDGCSATCQIEAGFLCEGGTEMVRDWCHPKCGDGLRVPHEGCDDGNTEDGDGCSSECQIETGYACHGGSSRSTDTCNPTVCGDGIVEGAEECDDFNDFGGGGCSPSCLRESKEVASASETEVRVTVRPLAQVCRIYNAGQHQTLEDTTYHLQQTLFTGDVTNLTSLQIRIQVVDGSIAMKPLIDFYLARGRNDSTWEAIVERETGVRFYPYADNMKDTILTGSHFQASRFLRLYLYIEPDRNFFGNVQVDFTVVSGMAMNHGAEECTHGVVIEVEAVHDDPLLVTVSEDVQSNGFQCVAGSSSCSLAGLSVSDPDCEMTVDGSCFLRVELNVTLGFLRLPGHPDGWQAVFPPLMGHAPGLNAALSRLAYFPPAGPAGEDASLNFTVHRVIQRTMATPPALQPAVASRSLPVHVLAADTAPTVSLASGGAFHGAIFEITGAKPFRFSDIVFEPPGAIDTTCIIELEVSRGYLFLGDTEGLWFAGGTMNGESKLRFVSNSTDIRERFLADVRYTWDEHDCATLEEFNITVDSGHHPPLTLAAMLVLPDCQGFQAQWTGGSLNMDEDTEISIGHLHVSTHDPHLFLIVDVKHPGHVPGDCKVVRWPEAVSSFVPGRECHLDGLVNGLNDALPFLVYKPPPDFFGHVQLEFVLFRAEVRDELLGLDFRSSNSSFLVDIEVAGVNDGPMLDVFLDSYTLKEDLEEYLVLGPLFVSDIDAGQHPLSFKFELFSSHEGNLLMLCGLEGVQIEEPRGHLNEDGCLEMGTALVHFNTTVENFNSMQTGPGRLQFKPAPNWHGFARVNITVDDRGSGHGNEFHLLVERSLYLVVEPVIDKPELSHLCTEAMPFLTYGRTCLEVRECFALNATADSADQTISFWLVIEASDPGVSISLEDRAPLQVWREGTSELQAAGLYSNIQEALRALIFHPPPQIFAGPEDPDIFEFNISITAYALGQRFNEPLPFNPGTPGARPEGFPSDMIQFPVVVRRVNRRPFFFVDVPHFSVSQMQDDVRLYGVTVADPDARQNDDMEVEILVDSDSWGGAVAFAGERGTRIQRRMKLRELNRALQELTFVFEDANWFGVTGISVSVSDVGNRGWRVDHYAEMFREDIDPEAQVFYDDHNLFEQCVAYDRSLLGLAAAGGAGATGQPYVWHSPQAYAKLMRETHAYTLAGVNSTEWGPLMATTFLAVHRSFVNEPPRIVLLEPQSGVLNVFEDHANFASFLVRHKAAEFLVERTLSIFLTTSHGRVQSISSSATAKSSVDGKRLEYRASLFELNKFLAQLQFAPDPNYNGPDELVILLTDDEYAVNTSVPIEIASLSDPLSIICPPAVDLFEGQHVVPIGDNISIRDYEPIPGSSDDDSQVAVEIFVGAGGLHLQLDRVLPEMHEELSQVSNDSMQLNRSTPGVPGFIFNTSLAVFRAALKALSFTPYPELYHGVVHLEIRVAAQETHERTKCEIGLIVHPVNTPPVIRVDDKRLLAGTNGGIVKPHKEIPLHGVIQLSDPDEEDFSGGWFVERVHSARLQLRASCGTISFLIAGPQDHVFGVQNGSIAGTEGITFHSGDGFHDTDMDITSTLRNLNLQLGRLFYHSGGGCRGQNITISVELDDLGNFGASMDEMGNYGHPYPIVVTNQVQFQVSEY